ncbi:hypothetical protein H8356DRAFT_1352763 [Neocallimastix lanati (nom. inval.)]|nr:hypothetical protein H8356DRAFT_1352763 [Neocallimastix sp. JGI-2020a]
MLTYKLKSALASISVTFTGSSPFRIMKSLVDSTLSILKTLLLCFIIFDLTGVHVFTHSIHHTEL